MQSAQRDLTGQGDKLDNTTRAWQSHLEGFAKQLVDTNSSLEALRHQVTAIHDALTLQGAQQERALAQLGSAMHGQSEQQLRVQHEQQQHREYLENAHQTLRQQLSQELCKEIQGR